MDIETIESLREILDYLRPDERKHWEEAGKPASGHIHHDITRVTAWLDAGGEL